MRQFLITIWLVTALVFLISSPCTDAKKHGCSDVVCVSVVSKCLLTKACNCDIHRQPSECSCCHTCTQCLGNDYKRCCACLGLCEPSTNMPLSSESQVGDISDPFTSLFEALTSVPDELNLSTHYTFPIDETLQELGRRANVGNIKYEFGSQINCTVMYMSQCISVTKCQTYCNQRGAASYRYFYNGCCECVGHTCFNYGINEARCSACYPPVDDVDPEGNEIKDGKQ